MDRLEPFIDASVRLTGFSRTELLGTGSAEEYLKELEAIVPSAVLHEFLGAFGCGPVDEAAIMENPAFAPIAKNIIVLWYCGKWRQLPEEWRATHGRSDADTTHVVSANAYLTGLMWKVVGAHPPGGNMQGFAAWSLPPEVT